MDVNDSKTIDIPCIQTNASIQDIEVSIKSIDVNQDQNPDNDRKQIAYTFKPNPILNNDLIQQASCGHNGEIRLKVNNGQSPFYFFEVNQPDIINVNGIFSNLTNSAYTHIVVDRNNCRDTLVSVVPNYCPDCLDGIVNKYAKVLEICSGSVLTVNSTVGFKQGDKVLIYQAKGATFSASNSENFGNLIDINNAGAYEINYIEKINGLSVELKFKNLHNYDVNALVQMVTIPDLNGKDLCNLTC